GELDISPDADFADGDVAGRSEIPSDRVLAAREDGDEGGKITASVRMADEATFHRERAEIVGRGDECVVDEEVAAARVDAGDDRPAERNAGNRAAGDDAGVHQVRGGAVSDAAADEIVADLHRAKIVVALNLAAVVSPSADERAGDGHAGDAAVLR